MLKINGRDLKILVAGRRGTLGNRDGKMEPGIGRKRGQGVTGHELGQRSGQERTGKVRGRDAGTNLVLALRGG